MGVLDNGGGGPTTVFPPPDSRLEMALSELPDVINTVYQGNAEQRHDAVKKVRQLLSIEQNPPIQRV